MLVAVVASACGYVAACTGEDPDVINISATDGGPTSDADAAAPNDSSTTNDGASNDAGADVGVDADLGPFYVFVTETTYRGGDLGGLAGADAKCATQASSLGLGGKYIAWLSTSTVNAIDRVPTNAGPWRRKQDGAVVFGGRGQLANGGGATASVSLGAGPAYVWTSTDKNGAAVYIDMTSPKQYLTCDDWTSIDAAKYGYGGEATAMGENWTYNYSLYCDKAYPIYCFRSE